MIDTHTHLYATEFDQDRCEIIETAIQQGVEKMFLPNIDSSSIAPMLDLANQFPKNCFPMIGLHPCSVNATYKEELSIVEEWLQKMKENQAPKFYAIGEIGIDLYWDKTFITEQKEAFEQQLMWAKKYDLPIVIHTRNSFKETYDLVYKYNDQKLRGIFHCFSGSIEEANQIIDLGGFKLGIGGVITFKNTPLCDIITNIHLQHIVLETDSPYLAPTPYRGKRNESSYLPIIAHKIADIKQVHVQEVIDLTTHSALEIFDL